MSRRLLLNVTTRRKLGNASSVPVICYNHTQLVFLPTTKELVTTVNYTVGSDHLISLEMPVQPRYTLTLFVILTAH